MSQFGKLNWSSLSRYLIKASDFLVGQGYQDDFGKELAISRDTAGVVYGCDLTVVSGLTVNMASGLVLFSSGQLVAVPSQNITLDTADPTNPRYDRIELAYSLDNGTSVTNIDGVPVYLDQKHDATVQKNDGTPAGSPTKPTLTAGRISVGVVRVNAGATTLTSPNITQLEDTDRTISYLKFGSTGIPKIRWSQTNSRFELTEDGTNWFAFKKAVIDDVAGVIANNTASATAVPGLATFDSAVYRAVTMSVFLALKDATPSEFVEVGTLKLVWRQNSSSWDIIFNSDFDSSGVVFTVATVGTVATVKYTSPNLTGGSYVGIFRIGNFVLQAA